MTIVTNNPSSFIFFGQKAGIGGVFTQGDWDAREYFWQGWDWDKNTFTLIVEDDDDIPGYGDNDNEWVECARLGRKEGKTIIGYSFQVCPAREVYRIVEER